jgi:hypothetical protein
MPLMGGAADCVLGYDDTIPVINRAKRSRKNTDVGFGAYENKCIAMSSHQFMVQLMTSEGRINRLVDHQSRGGQIWKRLASPAAIFRNSSATFQAYPPAATAG